MNIFFLDRDPSTCARYHVDKHASKMVLETAQLLSTAHHLCDSPFVFSVYRMTHRNHPSAIWARESKAHYEWLYGLFMELNMEFKHRYGKDHLSYTKLDQYLSHVPPGIQENSWLRDPPQCMPSEYHDEDTIKAYRSYYIHGKKHLHAYTNREYPHWIMDA